MQSRKLFDFEGFANHYEVGDAISFQLSDGEVVKAMAMRQEDDAMTFVLVDSLREARPMYERGHEIHGYEESDLRRWLNTVLIDRFPTEVRHRMVAFENGDSLRIPSEKEIFGRNEYGHDDTDTRQWEPMKERRNRIAFQGIEGDWQYWWLRDVVSSAYFALVSYNGDAANSDASNALGICPAFKIVNP